MKRRQALRGLGLLAVGGVGGYAYSERAVELSDIPVGEAGMTQTYHLSSEFDRAEWSVDGMVRVFVEPNADGQSMTISPADGDPWSDRIAEANMPNRVGPLEFDFADLLRGEQNDYTMNSIVLESMNILNPKIDVTSTVDLVIPEEIRI